MRQSWDYRQSRHGGKSSQSHRSKRDIKNQNSFCAVWQVFVLLFSQYENYFVWTNKVLFDPDLVTIKWLALLHISVLYCSRLSFSKHTPSSSCVKPVAAFRCRLCPLPLLFGRENPGSQALPLILSFRHHHVVPGSHFPPGCPGLLWFHYDLLPQGAPGTHVMYVHIPVCPPLQDGSGC